LSNRRESSAIAVKSDIKLNQLGNDIMRKSQVMISWGDLQNKLHKQPNKEAINKQDSLKASKSFN
jgi:DNA-binding HxlR family transcriptional regulator